MPNKPKRQVVKTPSYMTFDLSPQQERQLIAIAIRKSVTEALMEAHHEAKQA